MTERSPAHPPPESQDIPRLLTLPQEIRDVIIEYVIASPLPKPDGLETKKFVVETALNRERCPAQLPRYQIRNLALTCRSLSLDTLAASARISLPPTIIIDSNCHKLYWGHFPYFTPRPDENERVLERIDLMANAQVRLTPPYKVCASGSNVSFTLEGSFLRTIESIVEEGFEINKGPCESHCECCGIPKCSILCSARELHIYLPNGPGLSEYIESGLQASMLEEESWQRQLDVASRPLYVETLSFWQENRLVSQYDLSEVWTGMIDSEDWLQKRRKSTVRKEKLLDIAP